MQKITNKTVQKLKGNQVAIGRLMALFNRSAFSINRWIEDKDVRLTTPQAIQIISEETGLGEDKILEPEIKAA
jgi:hypothetical protein